MCKDCKEKDAEIERLRFDVSERLTPAHVQTIADLRTQLDTATKKFNETEELRANAVIVNRRLQRQLDTANAAAGEMRLAIDALLSSARHEGEGIQRIQACELGRQAMESTAGTSLLRELEQLRKDKDELRAVLLKCRDTVGIYISCAGHHSDGDDPCPRCQIASEIDGALALHTTSKPA